MKSKKLGILNQAKAKITTRTTKINSFFVALLIVLVTSTNLAAQNITQVQPLNGTAGTSVTIYGSGFDASTSANTVSFIPVGGGSATTATVTAASATKLTITVPAITGGNYSLSVQRASDNATANAIELFSVSIKGGDFGAIGSSENVVSTDADGGSNVYAADVDGDGDFDLMSASFRDDKIAWYENDGAANASFTEHVVSTNADGAVSVHAADLDGDGDLDLMSASIYDDKIAWHENDGSQNFTERVVSTNADGAYSVFAADLDGDGDLDLMSASAYDDKIAWYENNGAANPTFNERVVSTNADNTQSIFAADVDGDGDLDLMSASADDDKIAWYENNGAFNPSFTERVVSTNANGARSVYAGDVDGDGDIDLMSTSYVDDKVAWYENNGGSNPSFTERVVSTNADGAEGLYAGDIDGDGDLDLMSAASRDDKIAWYENDGAADPSFNEHVISTNADGALGVFAVDLNGDGDLDLMSASNSGDKIAWYENAPASGPLVITKLQQHYRAAGATITIYGSGFDAASNNTVSFTSIGNGTATTANVTAASATKLTVTVPPVTKGRYNISVERRSDGANTTSLEFFGVLNAGGYFGTVGSSEQVVSTNADLAQSVHAADVDGDGDIDIMSTSKGDTKVAWYENDGSQNFTERVVSSSSRIATNVFTGDVDGDGDLDLLSAEEELTWYENDGSQNFTKNEVSTTIRFPSDLYAQDVDGDGDLDLIVASYGDNGIVWYENDGAANPTFAEHFVSTNANGAYSVYGGDVDGDGDIDIMSASIEDDKIAWYENDGSQTFTEHIVSTNADIAVNVYAADVDGDGDLDLLSASQDDNKIAWYENDGAADPSFTERVVSTNADNAKSVFAGDVDGDGDLDLMSASGVDKKIAWYENDGATDPSFTERVVSTNSIAAISIFAADVDGDGDLDLLSASGGDDKIAWYENTTPAPSITKLQPLNGTAGTSITMHGYGFDDVITDNKITFTPAGGGIATTATVTSASATKLTVTVPEVTGGNYTLRAQRDSDSDIGTSPELFDISTGGGDFGAIDSSERIITTNSIFPYDVYAADVDSDGDMDLLSASYGDDKIAWYENDGATAPSFTEHVVSTNADGVWRVHAADVDGDGDIDLLSASIEDDKIAWYENNGAANPSFTEHLVSTNADYPTGIYTADVDSDGDLDLMSTSRDDDKIAWYENDGSQNFTEHIVSTNADYAASIYAADVDSDGDLDLMSASQNDFKIAWYENDGSQNFIERIVSLNAINASSVYAADVDRDGDLDIMSASSGHDKIAWYENNGATNPTFTERVVSTTADNARSVYAADVDGDGDLDLMSASENDDKIAWYENDGSQTFTEQIVSTNAKRAQSVFAADIDGDGDLDLMSASTSGGKIAWYENKSPISTAGRGITFDGAGDYIEVGDNNALDLTNDFTIEGWLKTTFEEDPKYLVYKEDSYSVTIQNNAVSLIINNGTEYSLSHSFTSNKWVHIAVAFDSNNDATFFVDGKSIGTVSSSILGKINPTSLDGANIRTVASSNPANNSANPLFIGGTPTTGSINGSIDELRFWNTTRTEEEISTNMYQELSGAEDGLIVYFPFNEENGNTTTDRSTNALVGTLHGDATQSENSQPYGAIITGNEGWRIMSAPVSGVSYGELLDTLWTQGFTGADINNGQSSNVLVWSEATQSFSSIANASSIPSAGQGFITYVYDDDDLDGTPDGFPKHLLTENTQRSGNVSPTLSFTDSGSAINDGWNLVGNPYGATIDWDATSGLTSSNLDATFYVWSSSANSGSGAYLTWNGSTGTLTDGKIAPWQGFWVKANAADPTLSLTDEARSSNGVFLKKKETPVLSFTLKGNELESTTIVSLQADASIHKDKYDAYKLGSLNSTFLLLYTSLDNGDALDINVLPSNLDEALFIPFDINGSNLDGVFELGWNTQALPDDWSFTLVNNMNGEEVNLLEESSFNFELDAPAKQISSEQIDTFTTPLHGVVRPSILKAKAETQSRFTLRIVPAGLSVSNEETKELPRVVELQQNYPNPFNPSTTIAFGLPQSGKVTLEIFNVLGRKVATLLSNENKTAGRHSINLDARNLSSGMYIYRLQVGNTVITKKLTLIK
ncbi:MAG: VCBS repeat-containing protein [Balneola sp.]